MESFDFAKAAGRAVIALIVGLIVAALMKMLGAGKWVAAAGSGAVGGLVAVAVIA